MKCVSPLPAGSSRFSGLFSLLSVSLGVVTIFAVLSLSACSRSAAGRLKEYDETRPYLGTYVRINCFMNEGTDIAAVIARCWARLDLIQRHMNIYARPVDGDLARLNASGTGGVRVHEDVYRALRAGVDYARATGGAFDVTVLPLVRVWRDAARQGVLPTAAMIAQAKSLVGYQHLVFREPDQVAFDREGVQADLGAIASGYACDRIAAILDDAGVKHFLVDAGGEIYCRGAKAGVRPWRIAIRDPFDAKRTIGSLALRDRALSTSGSYEKFIQIGAERFSHIIDPVNGYPQREVVSATVIASTVAEADALSTALAVLGGKKGLACISRAFPHVEALVIEEKNGVARRYMTKGFRLQ